MILRSRDTSVGMYLIERWRMLVALGLAASLVACSPSPQSEPHAHEGEEDHGEEDGHSHNGHDHDEADHDEDALVLSTNEAAALGLSRLTLQPARLTQSLDLPGEVRFDENRLAHVSPRVPGLVREVFVSEGDVVDAGQVLARLDSRALADAKADYLSSRAMLALAQSAYEREHSLFERQIIPESRFLEAEQAREEARIQARRAGQQLSALGVDEAARARLSHNESDLTTYEILAPLPGTIIERHAVLGETLSDDNQDPAFIIADTTQVWVDAAIYGDDLGRVRPGQRVLLDIGDGAPMLETTISFVSPAVGERTRTGRARMVIDNHDARLRPGMFITVKVQFEGAHEGLILPPSALVTLEGAPHVFVIEGERYEAREVTLGARTPSGVQINAGLSVGETIVSEGAFGLKAELQKGAFGDGHAH
ncbi:efflux RND transporter periplasmic adaptor subunit [Woodsholea maritima]|uniref:efflux RND transporter periplasmic adaptor subunit n=1 Tax=Woodsholea maritima TaxID=240237 RepID=UPI000399840A|nr:efflux RND transporter periplasmic adaptor subunit [Woodsholea maritima]